MGKVSLCSVCTCLHVLGRRRNEERAVFVCLYTWPHADRQLPFSSFSSWWQCSHLRVFPVSCESTARRRSRKSSGFLLYPRGWRGLSRACLCTIPMVTTSSLSPGRCGGGAEVPGEFSGEEGQEQKRKERRADSRQVVKIVTGTRLRSQPGCPCFEVWWESHTALSRRKSMCCLCFFRDRGRKNLRGRERSRDVRVCHVHA